MGNLFQQKNVQGQTPTVEQLGRMYLHGVYANSQQVAGLDEAGNLDVLSRLTAFSNSEAGRTQVVVQAGETLRGLAQRVYGNANLWFVIAEANALDGDGDLVAGSTLTVPEVKTSSNDASTFKPYNPSEITGPTTPGLPYIAPPSSAGCNPVMMILMAVVTIVVAVYAPVLAPSLSNVFGGAVIGGTGAFAGSTIGGAIAASTLVGAGASAVAQGIGSVLGETSFSWRQAALDGVMAGATAGMANTSVIGNAAKKLGGSAFVRGAVSSVTTNLTSQAAQRLVGMETHFSWKSIAASAVSGGIAQMVTPALTAGIRTDEGLQAASGIIGGVIGLHTRRSFGFDNPINYGAIMADAFGNMLATSVTRNMSASGTGDRVTDKLHGINADLQAKLEAKAGALVDGYLDTRLARCQSDMTFPEWEISGSDRTRSTVIKTVAPPLRYQSSDGQLWSDIPKVRRSTDFKDVATGQITNAVPDVMVVRDTRTSQHFMQQWEHAYRYNLPAPTQASWGYLEARRQALDGILRPAYNAYASERIAFTQAQMPQPVVQRYMTNAEFSAWRKQDNFSFLKFMGGTALMGVLPAVATASPLVGAAMSGWSIGSGVNSFRDGNYVQGSLELAGGLLGLGVAGVQIRAATTVKQAMYMPLGSNGTAGALSAEVRTWEDLGVRSVRVGDAAPSTTINVSNSRVFSVDRTMHAADEAAGVLANGSYIRNPSARNLTDMVTESGRIGGKQTNGQFMYVIDRDGTIIVGSRSGQRMPHPTLVGGENPQVLGAGIVDIRGGKIYSVDNASGHFKPGPGSLDVARNTFGQLPPNVFRRDFQGYLPYKPGGN